MSNQSSIDSHLGKIKKWYILHYPLCLFCGHRIKEGEEQLAHIIRKSESRGYQDLKLNVGLAHHDCHDIFDNKPEQAIYLPRFREIMFITWLIDPNYFEQLKTNVYPFYEFPDFEAISNKYALHISQPSHHGELLYLPVGI